MSNYSKIVYSSQASQWATASNATVKLEFVVFRSNAHDFSPNRPALVLYDQLDPHVGFLVFKDPGAGFYTGSSHPNNRLEPYSVTDINHIGTNSGTIDLPISMGFSRLDVLRVFNSTTFLENSNKQGFLPWTFRSYVKRVIGALALEGILNPTTMGVEDADDLLKDLSPYLPTGGEILDHSKPSLSSF